MHMSLIILTPILISLWIYFLIIIVESFFQHPTKPLQLNIINKNGVIEKTVVKENDSSENNSKNNETNTKNRKSFHVPKFMLELYEKNRREGKNLQNSDIVKSLIPSHSGIFLFFSLFNHNYFNYICYNYLMLLQFYNP